MVLTLSVWLAYGRNMAQYTTPHSTSHICKMSFCASFLWNTGHLHHIPFLGQCTVCLAFNQLVGSVGISVPVCSALPLSFNRSLTKQNWKSLC